MNRQARVILAYATVKVLDPTGKPTVYGFHKDNVFPPNADPEDVARQVRRGYAEWVDGEVEKPPAGPAQKAETEPVAVEKPAAKSTKAETK